MNAGQASITGPCTQGRALPFLSASFSVMPLQGNCDEGTEKSSKRRAFELSTEREIRFQLLWRVPDLFTEFIQLQNGYDDTQFLSPSEEMFWLKVPQEEDTTQLKDTIIIQLEKCLHRTSELIPAKYDSACAVCN